MSHGLIALGGSYKLDAYEQYLSFQGSKHAKSAVRHQRRIFRREISVVLDIGEPEQGSLKLRLAGRYKKFPRRPWYVC